MAWNALRSRFIESRFAEALEDSPVVLIQGPRQCGKSTLAQMVCAPEFLPGATGAGNPASRGYGYLSFDDDVVRAGAEIDPMGFIAGLPESIVLDEVQRVPGLFTALKLEVDRRARARPVRPHRFYKRAGGPDCAGLAGRSSGDSPPTSSGPVRAVRGPPRR